MRRRVLPEGEYDLMIAGVGVWQSLERRMFTAELHVQPAHGYGEGRAMLALSYSEDQDRNARTDSLLKTLALCLRDGTPELAQGGYVWREDYLSLEAFFGQFDRPARPFCFRASVEHRYDVQVGSRWRRNLSREDMERAERTAGSLGARTFRKARVVVSSIQPASGEEPVVASAPLP